MPINGRNTGALSLLLPGVVSPNPSTFSEIRNFGGGRPYVNGNREQTNNYMIDGVDMNESIDNLVAYQPSPDAIAEISVETNNYAADTGNVAGAVISNVIKSGSNNVPRQRLRVLSEQRDGRELLGQQPLWRGQAGAAAGHLRRHARRPARQEPSCSSSRDYQGTRYQRARVRDALRRTRSLAARRSVQHQFGHPRPADGTDVCRQPNPSRVESARSLARSSPTPRSIRCRTGL